MEDRAVLEGNWLQGFYQSQSAAAQVLPDRWIVRGPVLGRAWDGTLESNRHMRDVLLAKGYDVHYREFVGGHDYLSWRGLLADGLISLIGKN